MRLHKSAAEIAKLFSACTLNKNVFSLNGILAFRRESVQFEYCLKTVCFF